MKKTFTVIDNYNIYHYDREFIFVGSEEQIKGLQELCMAEYLCPEFKVEDELGIFAIPMLQGTFTPVDKIPEWMSEYMPGFHLEFIDDDGIPYFSTCDGLELWYKENYEWFTEVLRINQQIADLNARMFSSSKSASKSDIKHCECELALAYKKLDDMDFDCIDVVEALSQPIKLYRHISSESDMSQAFTELLNI